MNKILNMLGMCRKAGCLEIGEENSGIAVRWGKAKVLMLASDASDNARHRAEGFVYETDVELLTLPFTKLEISMATGKNGCSMAAVADIGFASNITAALAQQQPEAYSEVASEMHRREEKARQRKKEALAHERNKRTGKKRDSRDGKQDVK